MVEDPTSDSGSGSSIRQVASEKGIDPRTIRKMLDHTLPLPYGPRSHRYPKLGPPRPQSGPRLRENATLPPTARRSAKGTTSEFAMRKASAADTAR